MRRNLQPPRAHLGPCPAPAGAAGCRALWILTAILSATAGCAGQPEPSVQAGQALYAENGCMSCHGSEGRGDGAIAASLDPRPRDFRDAKAFKRGADVDAIAATLATGMLVDVSVPRPDGNPPLHHREGMPPFGHLSEIERRSLALFVTSFHDRTP